VRVVPEADPDPAAVSLAARIDALTFAGLDEDAVTALLIDTVADWARERGWRVYRRAPSVMPLPPPYTHRHSVLDLGIARAGAAPLAVEVDRTDRSRTRDKLLAEAAAGRVAIWLRWGTRAPAPPPAPIHLVACPVTVGPDHRYSREPDRPAPRHSDLRVEEQMDLFPEP
jgi:hypothetical protein